MEDELVICNYENKYTNNICSICEHSEYHKKINNCIRIECELIYEISGIFCYAKSLDLRSNIKLILKKVFVGMK